MKLLGLLLALLGGVLKAIDPLHLNLVSDGTQHYNAGAAGIGIVPLAIFASATFGFFGDSRLAGIALMFVSIIGLFIDGGLLIALPFIGSILVLWAANMQTSSPNS
ncbi:MAG TPA: hypothetical protein VH835_03235 [Dongiaceae bacterium]|jgi:hypothetical protein